MNPSDAPLVSICIPAYNAERYLAETLASVAAQTYPNWEVIVTEDGSKDGTEAIVRKFSATVSQFCIYGRHPENLGLPSTRNSGIELARGEWVAFLDADDVWDPEHLARTVAAAQKSSADLIFTGTESFDSETGKTIERYIPTAEQLADLPVALYTGKLSILPSSVLIKREAFNRYGLISLDFRQVNDTEYWLRILRKGGKIAYSGAVTLRYRKHPHAMSNRAAEILEDSARLCENYADWSAIPGHLRRSRPANLYRWAGRTLLAYDPAEARRLSRRALQLQPLNPRTLGLWARACLAAR